MTYALAARRERCGGVGNCGPPSPASAVAPAVLWRTSRGLRRDRLRLRVKLALNVAARLDEARRSRAKSGWEQGFELGARSVSNMVMAPRASGSRRINHRRLRRSALFTAVCPSTPDLTLVTEPFVEAKKRRQPLDRSPAESVRLPLVRLSGS
jgi:hypothetical protein